MTLPKPSSMDIEDDDWLHDSTTPYQGGVADPLTNVEYDRLASKYSDAGYREGITDGKLSTLQEGFDSSFTSSVHPSRTLGGLRGRVSALLSLASIRSTNTNLDALRDLMMDLNRVKRNEVLPIDTEREEHEKEEHGDDNAFELEGNEKRDMEGLENALESLGGTGKESDKGGKREDELLRELEGRLERLEREMKGMTD